MELNQLKYFVSVARCESISKAADTLNLSQPALSKSISRLESELGTRLFDRQGRCIRLNDSGRLFLQKVEESLSIIEEASFAVSTTHDLSGSVTVGILGPQAEASACLCSFMEANTQVKVSIDARRIRPSQTILNEYDLIFYAEDNTMKNISGIRYATNRRKIAVAKSHPLAGAGEIDLAQLKENNFVFPDSAAGTYEQSYNLCIANGFTPKVRAITSSGAIRISIIAQGIAVGFIESTGIQSPHPDISLLDIRGASSSQPLMVATRPTRLLSGAARSLLDFTLGYFHVPKENAYVRFGKNR